MKRPFDKSEVEIELKVQPSDRVLGVGKTLCYSKLLLCDKNLSDVMN